MSEALEHKRRLAEMEAELEDVNSKIARFKGLIYGPSGTGKTVFAVGMMKAILKEQKKQRIVYVDTSEGWVSIRNHKGLADNVLFVPFRGYDYLETLLLAIQKGVGKFENVGGIILDEATKMAARDLTLVFKARGKSEAPEWPDYFKALERMKQLLTFIYEESPSLNLIMVGHEKDKKNNEGVVIKTFPSFNPQVAEEIKGDLHLVTRATTKQTGRQGEPVYTREYQVHPTTLVDAKTRVAGLPVKTDAQTLIAKTVDWLKKGAPEQEVNEPAVDVEKVVEELDNVTVDNDDAPVYVAE